MGFAVYRWQAVMGDPEEFNLAFSSFHSVHRCGRCTLVNVFRFWKWIWKDPDFAVKYFGEVSLKRLLDARPPPRAS